MATLTDVLAYLVKKYPHKAELSKARLTKMIYLADWRHAITRGRQLTDTKWKFHHYGPYVDDVREAAIQRTDVFSIKRTENMYGGVKELILIRDRSYAPKLTEDEKASVDHVIEQTRRLYWSDFMQLVYSTYPVMTSHQGDKLDLITKAKEYRSKQRNAAG